MVGHIPELANLTIPGDGSLNYASYLKIKELLQQQHPLSQPEEHDELLFIITHQAYELWFKQMLHEIDFAQIALKQRKTMNFLKVMTRLNRIQSVLNQFTDILETMTPNDFNRFRNRLNPASGFQSAQFRILEYRLGIKNPQYQKFFTHEPSQLQDLDQAFQQQSLYETFQETMLEAGFAIQPITPSYPPVSNPRLVEALTSIYQDPDAHFELYMACEALIDLDEKLLLWRFKHVAMVERMIGNKAGTGGSSGVGYLSQTLSLRFFRELWEVRNRLAELS